MRNRFIILSVLTLAASCIATLAHAAAEDGKAVLRVCADPSNLPQSNRRGEGYENKIAAALAADLGRRVEYMWFPQRMGFVRNTLKQQDPQTREYKCDLIIGVPKGYELTATTQPYMRSTYALIFPWRPELEGVQVAEDLLKLPAPTLKSLRFGVFGRSPGADWLLRNGLMEQAIVYAPQSGDPEENPAHTVERDLLDKKIDLAIVWGPVAGHLVREHAAMPMWYAAPFLPDPAIKFDYEISMGVRFGEKEWKAALDEWIAAHRDQLADILTSYRIPLLDANGRMIADFRQEERVRGGSVNKEIPLRLAEPR